MEIRELIEKLEKIENDNGNINVILRCGVIISKNIDVIDENNETYAYNRISIVDMDRY